MSPPHHSRSAEIIPLWDQPLDYERRPNLYASFESDPDSSWAAAIFDFIRANIIAAGLGTAFGMLCTVGLAYVIKVVWL